MKGILTAYLILLGCLASQATEPIQISNFSTNGDFSASVSRAYWAVEWCTDVNGTWLPCCRSRNVSAWPCASASG